MKEVSFIHAADLHLDSPFKGLTHVPEHIFKEIQHSTFMALDRLVQTAVNKKVDFVLLAGDLFDNEKQSLKAQIRLRGAFEKLDENEINVYMSYGNHDFINGNKYPITYPDNVFIFNDEKVSYFTHKRNNQSIARIYGFSYEERAVVTNKAKEYDVIDESIPYHIAMLHGSLHSNAVHDVYAPFHINDLTKKNMDYWALGHIHQREILKSDPYILYPGNIQGRNPKETGEKGCYHIQLTETASEISFLPLQSIIFTDRTIDISSCEKPFQIEPIIHESISDRQHESSPQLLSITLTSTNAACKQWENEGLFEDIIELLNESMIYNTNWQYIYRYSIDYRNSLSQDELYKGEHFVGELVRHSQKASIQPFLQELFHHKQARKYVQTISSEEEQFIKNEAEQLLIHELLRDVGD